MAVVAYSSTLPSTISFNSFPALKNGTLFSGTETFLPVLGLRPSRVCLFLILKLPNPLISILSPPANASLMLSNSMLTIISVCFFVSPSVCSDTFSMRSVLVICPSLKCHHIFHAERSLSACYFFTVVNPAYKGTVLKKAFKYGNLLLFFYNIRLSLYTCHLCCNLYGILHASKLINK